MPRSAKMNSSEKSSDDGTSRSMVRWIKSLIPIVKNYSEYSTIQGIIYIFQSGQSIVGRIFWIFVVVLMLYFSAQMSWQVSACHLESITPPLCPVNLYLSTPNLMLGLRAKYQNGDFNLVLADLRASMTGTTCVFYCPNLTEVAADVL